MGDLKRASDVEQKCAGCSSEEAGANGTKPTPMSCRNPSSDDCLKEQFVTLACAHAEFLNSIVALGIIGSTTSKPCTTRIGVNQTVPSLPPDAFRSQIDTFCNLMGKNANILRGVPQLAPWCDLHDSLNEHVGRPRHCYNGAIEMLKSMNEKGVKGSNVLVSSSSESKEYISKQSSAMKPPQTHVRVGVGVIVRDSRNPKQIFAGKRKGSHGAGSIALPGGHLEMYESWEDCAVREVLEEMGVAICNVQFAHVTNDPMQSEGKHYTTIFMMAELEDINVTPMNCEPHKCEGWNSYTLEALQDINRASCAGSGSGSGLGLFGPLRRLVEDMPKALLEFLHS